MDRRVECEGTLSTSVEVVKRNLFSKILTWIFVFLFVVSTIGVLFSFFPVRKLLNPNFYQQALEDVRIYQRLPASIAKQLAANLTPSPGDSDSRISLLVLNEQEWETILLDFIDPIWLQSQSEQVIDQVFEIILTSPDPLNTPIEISVTEVKDNLAGPDGVLALNQIIEAQPPCSMEQLVGLVQLGLGMENSLGSLLCRPPDFIISELNPFIESFLSTTVGQLPDQIQFFLPLSTLENQTVGISLEPTLGEIPEPIRIIRQANFLISWSPLLPVIFLLLMTIFAVRSLRDFMSWWGGSLFTAGIISLTLMIILVPAAKWAIASFIPLDISSFIGLQELFLQIGFADLSGELLNQLLMSIVIPASMLTAIGLALLLGVFLLSRNTPKTKPQPINPTDQAITNGTG